MHQQSLENHVHQRVKRQATLVRASAILVEDLTEDLVVGDIPKKRGHRLRQRQPIQHLDLEAIHGANSPFRIRETISDMRTCAKARCLPQWGDAPAEPPVWI
jgi:hypothetical protein